MRSLKGAGDLQSIELMFVLSIVDTLNVAAGQSKLSSQCVGCLKGAGDLQSIELMFVLPVVDSLNVAAGQSKLSSQSVWGALRGLETFSQ